MQRKQLKENITIYIKTFYGKRERLMVNVRVDDTIDMVKDKLIKMDKESELCNYHAIRLIYPIV